MSIHERMAPAIDIVQLLARVSLLCIIKQFIVVFFQLCTLHSVTKLYHQLCYVKTFAFGE